MARGDLTDEQWERVELLLPLMPKMGRPPRDRGQVFGGIWWWARTGSPWRDVPGRYEPWEAAYSVFRRCQINGTWACVLGELQVEADADGVIVGGSARPDGLPGASACRRCPQKGDHDPGWTRANYLAAEPYDRALGRSRGGLSTKLHLAVAGSGHVLAVTVTGGQRGGALQFTRLMYRIRVARTSGGRTHSRPSRVIADPACSSRVIRACLRRLQIPHTIPGAHNWAGHRLRRGTAGGRPPGFDRELCKRR
ncbi:IS5 family transposase [Streptomyces sp. RTGN2]|uniref:IS5 family transposase n=1 Tax=Streptomyces sp. RTGN2 TaxID=3016525 RepID=UPI00333C5012